MFSESCSNRHHHIGDHTAADHLRDRDNGAGISNNVAGISDNVAGISDNSTEISDNAAGIGNIADNLTK